jgi:exopolyphosphatase/guanosine-5'-triphosphate,3'-diphosphate pyrophosphatase
MKLAALDLGSNSFHLLVVETDGNQGLTKIGSDKEVLGLGSVVQEYGRLSDVAYGRALDVVGRMATVARELGAVKLLAVGTSALRDARNGAHFCADCSADHGVHIELLSGDDEARLAYRGAQSALPLTNGRVLVADVGGGSVELAVGEGANCETVQSLQLGFLRLAHAFPLKELGGATRLRRYVQLECEKARWQLGRFDTLLLSGGTARAIGKLLGGGIASASTAQVHALCAALTASSSDALLARGVERPRAPVLGAGAAVISGLLAGLGLRELRISPRGLREGVILRELSRRAARAAQSHDRVA